MTDKDLSQLKAFSPEWTGSEWHRKRVAELLPALIAAAEEREVLMLRSVGAMAIAEREEGSENIVRDCPMLEAVWKLREQIPPEPAGRGRLDQAKRFALMNYDHWNEVTGFPTPHTSYYYEIGALVEDAVEFGFGVAHGQSWKTIMKRIKGD